jgi:excisionase family DNA binding protein
MGNKESSPSETPFHGKPENNEANHELEKAQLAVKQAEKEFKKRFEKYEPYDLSEIGSIFENARKKADISAFYIAQKRINLIIRNSDLVYKILKKKRASNNSDDYGESLDNPDDYFDALDKAKNLKKQLEIEIAELQLETTKQAQSGIDHHEKSSSIVLSKDSGSISETNKDNELLTTKELAKELKISESTIYHKSIEGKLDIPRIGRNYRIRRSEIGKLIETDKTKKQFCKEKCIPEYIFKVPRELITNVFVAHGYLTEPNAGKMVERFILSPSKMVSPIQWEKDLKSLMTFILVVEKLQLIETEAKKFLLVYGKEGIELEPLMRNFIERTKWNTTAFSRHRETILNALNDLLNKVQPNKDMEKQPFKKILGLYYDNQKGISIAEKYAKGIDLEMLKIVYDAIKTSQN